MMKPIFFVVFSCFLVCTTFAQKKAYQIYDKSGQAIPYDSMLAKIQNADIILFGELHNNAVCHWLELEVAMDLYKTKKDKLVLGAEMFESDDQIVMNEYLTGLIKHKHFTSEAKMWNNYGTDYRPLVDFAKEQKLNFIATNIPRRYANMVARNGLSSLESLSKQAKSYIAPLKFEVDMNLDCYKMFIDMNMSHGEQTPEKMAKAQASKDATMAHFILENFKSGNTFLHYNGAYHSDNFESIYWYLKQANKKLKIVTISTCEQEDLDQLDKDSQGVADYILVTPQSFTKTY